MQWPGIWALPQIFRVHGRGGGPADLNGAANKIARDLPSDCSSSHPIQTRSRQLTSHADTGVWYLGQSCVAQVNRKQGGVNPLTQKCYLIAGWAGSKYLSVSSLVYHRIVLSASLSNTQPTSQVTHVTCCCITREEWFSQSGSGVIIGDNLFGKVSI